MPGDNTSGVYFFGLQVEALPYATSYIPTLTGSTVTRATETLNGSGNSTLINSTEGVLYAEIATLSEEDKAVGSQIAISDGTTDKRVLIFSSAASGSEGDIKVAIVKSSTESEERIALDNSSATDLASFNKILEWSLVSLALNLNYSTSFLTVTILSLSALS